MSTWTEYVERIGGGATPAEISRQTGIPSPTVGRWWKGTEVSVDNVRKFADGYRRPLLEALVAAEVLTEEQARIKRVETVRALDVSSLTDEELVGEVLARMRRGDDRGDTAPMNQAADLDMQRRMRRTVEAAAAPPAQPRAALKGRRVKEEMYETLDRHDAVDEPGPEHGA